MCKMKMLCWCLFSRSKAHGLCHFKPGCDRWEGTPSLFPVPKERCQGLPQPQPEEVAQTFRSHSEETPAKRIGKGCGTTSIVSNLYFGISARLEHA